MGLVAQTYGLWPVWVTRAMGYESSTVVVFTCKRRQTG